MSDDDEYVTVPGLGIKVRKGGDPDVRAAFAQAHILRARAQARLRRRAARQQTPVTTTVPAGRYLIADRAVRVRVIGKTGTAQVLDWATGVYLDDAETADVLALLGGGKVAQRAAAAFGRRFHICGKCGRELSDPASRARGLGPRCMRSFELPETIVRQRRVSVERSTAAVHRWLVRANPEAGSRVEVWESLNLHDADEFRRKAIAWLGDRSELRSSTIQAADYEELRFHFRSISGIGPQS